MTALTDLSFEQWIEHAFGRALRSDCFPFFDDREEYWAPEPATGVAYLTRLFEDSAATLQWFSDRQIGPALWFVTSEDAHCIYSRAVPAEARARCVGAITRLFTDLFEPRCAPVLGHIDQPGAGPLNSACYMWWENFPPAALTDDPDRERLEAVLFDVMEATLGLANPACQESALHGLGHAAHQAPDRVHAIIDAWPRRHGASAELTSYAAAARCGCVL